MPGVVPKTYTHSQNFTFTTILFRGFSLHLTVTERGRFPRKKHRVTRSLNSQFRHATHFPIVRANTRRYALVKHTLCVCLSLFHFPISTGRYSFSTRSVLLLFWGDVGARATFRTVVRPPSAGPAALSWRIEFVHSVARGLLMIHPCNIAARKETPSTLARVSPNSPPTHPAHTHTLRRADTSSAGSN